MEKYFTQQDIENFFRDFRKLQNSYKLEKVHQLLNNPYARARYPVKFNYKPFKFIIMTSAFILGLSALIICWYYPSQEFLNALPKNTGTELKSELILVTNESKVSSTPCKYFEACKSSLTLDHFKLYPNPASSSVTIEFDNFEDIIGSISIVNMAGLKLRELLPNTAFVSGHNSFQMNLSGINSGIYLISVNTKKGFKTQRLIVSQ